MIGGQKVSNSPSFFLLFHPLGKLFFFVILSLHLAQQAEQSQIRTLRMFLRDKPKKVFCRLVVYGVRIVNRAVLHFQFGFILVAPPFVKYVCREISIQLRTVPNATSFVVDKRYTVNPSFTFTSYNCINTLFGQLFSKFTFVGCGVYC